MLSSFSKWKLQLMQINCQEMLMINAKWLEFRKDLPFCNSFAETIETINAEYAV